MPLFFLGLVFGLIAGGFAAFVPLDVNAETPQRACGPKNQAVSRLTP